MASNTAKYLSYKEAWRRITAATSEGYYFEAVTLCESIISDRLLSYAVGVNPQCRATRRTSFGTLIEEWRKSATSLPDHGLVDLGAAVDAWRVERNVVVHGLAKSTPGTATDDLQEFLKRAEDVAKQGAALAEAVSHWHKKAKANNMTIPTGDDK